MSDRLTTIRTRPVRLAYRPAVALLTAPAQPVKLNLAATGGLFVQPALSEQADARPAGPATTPPRSSLWSP
ncbi:hypothetical protein KZZ52_04410 [Dactylosporangium sp. AC04546]|uniref:hypothetical protein n=1 Tax=Dactylosporangium sp. AC04546 TaxID=2862460 RepID=UPI001EDCA517|nr:hypothetical protein [Dactylosporangium sp. AC04546]WVK84665.1 hypothetical protein KZZ52_04410 [Dactylosporangium sp. AC04546]